MSQEERIQTLHPQGKKGVNILKRRYDTIKAFILKTIKEREVVTYAELDELATIALRDTFDGKIAWYVVSVKLDLEARGIIERIPKTSPHKLRMKQSPNQAIFQQFKDIPSREIIKGFFGKLIHTERFTLALWDIKAGAVLPAHHHFHEQTTQVMEGEFELIVEEERQICQPGGIAIIPSNAVHSGRAVTDCKILDIFAPVREDYK